MEFDVDRSIAAPRDRIWAILTDAKGYSNWDNGIELIDGEIGPGSKFRLIPEEGERQFKITVVEFEPLERMAWKSGMPLGLFTGIRHFTLTESSDGTTYFRMYEVFSGPMLGMVAKRMPDLGPQFRRFVDGLKKQAESTV
jgi:hypothetical protein